jgi:hypothetical protein
LSVRFAHPPEAENDGKMEYWNIGSVCGIALKKTMNHEINPSWIEKTSSAVFKSSGFGKTPLPFMFWSVRYLSTIHSN